VHACKMHDSLRVSFSSTDEPTCDEMDGAGDGVIANPLATAVSAVVQHCLGLTQTVPV
jgi:hypothetical protein